MKRAREDGEDAARGEAPERDADAVEDSDAARDVALEVLRARATSESRRRSTWLDHGGAVELAPGARRVEINFPGSREEYERLLLETSSSTANARDAIERKLRGESGEDANAWEVSAVIVPEDDKGERRETAKAETTATWVQSYDAESDEFYYFHSETQETSWDRPVDVKIIPDELAAEKLAKDEMKAKALEKKARERAFAEAREDAEVTGDALDALKKHTSVDISNVKLPERKSWHYEDDYGNWQGPFTAAQLMMWRSMLPMELRLMESGDSKAETTLAEVLGDTPLLAQCAALGVVLPPRSTAAHAQEALRVARSLGYSADAPMRPPESEEEPQNDWAKAVMAGLPPERAIMSGADPAEVARKVLEKRAADLEASYSSAAVYNKFLHRITDASTIAKPTSVYGSIGLDNYVDTNTLDAALHEMKNRKAVKLTRKQIEALKERKRKLKDKFNNEWLRKDD